MERRLYRSKDDSVIFGVCAGLARYLNWDPTLVRVLFVLGAVVTQGGVIVGYLILALVMPKESREGPVTGEVMRENLDEMGQRTREMWDELRGTPSEQTAAAGPEPERRMRLGDPLVGGIILILAGVIFLLDSLRLFAWWQFGRLWPLILVAVGIALLLRRRER